MKNQIAVFVLTLLLSLASACSILGNADIEYGQARVTSGTGFTMMKAGLDPKNNIPTVEFPTFLAGDVIQNAPNTEVFVSRDVSSLWSMLFGSGTSTRFVWVKSGDSVPKIQLDGYSKEVMEQAKHDPEFAKQLADKIKELQLLRLQMEMNKVKAESEIQK